MDRATLQSMGLNPEQIDAVLTAYNLADGAEVTEAEKKELADMFSNPVRFSILRRVLQQFTDTECGLMFKKRENFVSFDGDFETTGKHYAVKSEASKLIQGALISLYQDVQAVKQGDLVNAFVKENKRIQEQKKDIPTEDFGDKL